MYHCSIFFLFSSSDFRPFLQIDKVVKSWTPVTALKMSSVVTCVKHLFLHFTVTSATLTSVRRVWGTIYQMILNFTQWSNIGNRFQCILNGQSILQNCGNSIVSNVTFLFVFNEFSPRNIRLTMQQIFYIFRKERKKALQAFYLKGFKIA